MGWAKDWQKHGLSLPKGGAVQGGIAAVPDPNQSSLGEPASHLQEHLPGPIGQLLVGLAPFLMITLRGSQHREKRQGPDPTGPGMGTSNIKHSQRRPLALTKWLWLERTGSR
jgi:hypothetical protein